MVHEGLSVLQVLEVETYDMLLLDLMLPDADGLTICAAARRLLPSLPILILTARGTVEDRVAGLDAGADDYVIKPFALEELLARLRALARRPGERGSLLLESRGVRLDPASRRAWRDEHELTLSIKQLALLEYLMRHEGRIVAAEELLEHVWDNEVDPFSATVRVQIMRLRHTLNEGFTTPLIETIRGGGYRL